MKNYKNSDNTCTLKLKNVSIQWVTVCIKWWKNNQMYAVENLHYHWRFYENITVIIERQKLKYVLREDNFKS